MFKKRKIVLIVLIVLLFLIMTNTLYSEYFDANSQTQSISDTSSNQSSETNVDTSNTTDNDSHVDNSIQSQETQQNFSDVLRQTCGDIIDGGEVDKIVATIGESIKISADAQTVFTNTAKNATISDVKMMKILNFLGSEKAYCVLDAKKIHDSLNANTVKDIQFAGGETGDIKTDNIFINTGNGATITDISTENTVKDIQLTSVKDIQLTGGTGGEIGVKDIQLTGGTGGETTITDISTSEIDSDNSFLISLSSVNASTVAPPKCHPNEHITNMKNISNYDYNNYLNVLEKCSSQQEGQCAYDGRCTTWQPVNDRT